ncbi:MAG: putative glycolipid-binding domain-containing protein [Paludibaculum sp.]
MSEYAIWRRLDTPGHDAASLTAAGEGWLLRGTAVFAQAGGPACVHYSVELDFGWKTIRGRVEGFAGGRTLDHLITRAAEGWTLDGVLVPGLEALCDLDYGFTPATNLQQLRRVAIGVGETAEIRVVWFDVGEPTLVELPQRYERRSESAYWYESPSGPYEALLELAPNGFVRRYPGLWVMEEGATGSLGR